MMRIVRRSKQKGFSYIEVLVAVSILMIAMLAILHAIALSIQQSMANKFKEEAVRIAEDRMNTIRNSNFAAIVNGNNSVTRLIGRTNRTFAVTWTVTSLTATSKVIEVTVQWPGREKEFSRTVRTTSIVSISS